MAVNSEDGDGDGHILAMVTVMGIDNGTHELTYDSDDGVTPMN